MSLVYPVWRREHPEFHTHEIRERVKSQLPVKSAVNDPVQCLLQASVLDTKTYQLQITPALYAQVAANKEVALAVVDFLRAQLEDKHLQIYVSALQVLRSITEALPCHQAMELLSQSLQPSGLSVMRCAVFDVLLERLRACSLKMTQTTREILAPWLEDGDRYIRHRASDYLHQPVMPVMNEHARIAG
jgi:hypothetical protein